MIYVGADWDHKKCVVSAGVEGTKKPIRCNVLPTVASTTEFVAELRARLGADEPVLVAIEAGNGYWVRLFRHAGAQVHVIDSKQAKAFASSMCSSGAKNNRRDADTLLLLAQSAHHRGEAEGDEPQDGIERLVALHEQLTGDVGRTLNRIRSHLAETMPHMNEICGDVRTQWVRRLLEAVPTPAHAASLSRPEFDALGLPRARREAIWAVLKELWNPLSAAEADAYARVIRALLSQLGASLRALRDCDAELERLTDAAPLTAQLKTLKGIGTTTAAALAPALEGADRDAAAVRTGVAPVAVHTGNWSRPVVKMRRSAPRRARAAAYMLGLQALRRLAWAKAQYGHCMQRGKSAATAMRIVARSYIRIILAILRTGEAYDEARYVSALKAKGVPWAAGL